MWAHAVPYLSWLAIIILAARLFAPLAQRIGFPAVLGELLLGVVLGNLGLLGIEYFQSIAKDPIILFMSELGVIILLLQIGLETRLGDLVSVGVRASMVGAVGITMAAVVVVDILGPRHVVGRGLRGPLALVIIATALRLLGPSIASI